MIPPLVSRVKPFYLAEFAAHRGCFGVEAAPAVRQFVRRGIRLVVVVLVPIPFLVPAALVFIPPLMPLTPATLPRIT
jgi:hypothetical protein